MTFWTIEAPSRSVVITLCDACALEATNMGVAEHQAEARRAAVSGLFQSMSEASVVFEAMLATIGYSTPITSSQYGTCQECGLTVDEEVSSHE